MSIKPSGTMPSRTSPSSTGTCCAHNHMPTDTRATSSGPTSSECAANAHDPIVAISPSAIPMSATSAAETAPASTTLTVSPDPRFDAPDLVGRGV